MSNISAVFIDRDGTLNEEVGYLDSPNDIVMTSNVAIEIAELNDRCIPVIVITNQSGIGRNVFGWGNFYAVTYRMEQLLCHFGVHIDGLYVAPHHPLGIGRYTSFEHKNRKPNTGLLLCAARDYNIDLNRAWMIGDRISDLKAGYNAGCRIALVRTGYGYFFGNCVADLVCDDLAIAIRSILKKA